MPKKPHFDPLDYASLVAHQLQSPIAAAGGLIKSLLGGYVGPLSDQQKDLIAKANARLDQASESVTRMLAISRAMKGSALGDASANLAAPARAAHQRYSPDAARTGTEFSLRIDAEPLYVPLSAGVLEEILAVLLSNAFKYTPDSGSVVLSVRTEGATAILAVSDSGVGIPEAERESIFEPFHRSSRTAGSARKGVGLGLAFVRTVALAAGGTTRAGKSELGGAEVQVSLPLLAVPAEAARTTPAAPGKKVVIIGGVSAGPKVAAKVIRLDPSAEVTVIDKGRFLSYAGCGLPYYVSGLVDSQEQLMSTAVGLVRDAVFFQKVKNVHVINNTVAVRIDRAARRVLIRDGIDGGESWLEYDKLVLATGAEPVVPAVPGVDLANIYTLHGVQDAEGIRSALASAKARDVVIIGGGLIGVEFTSALAAKGCRVTIVEQRPQILSMLDEEMAKLVEMHLESHGVRVMTSTHLESFSGAGAVAAAVTDKATLAADLVILAGGVTPNVQLARQAGLEIGVTGALKVDPHLCTSDPDIFAAGDCVENVHIVTGKPCYIPMGSTANRHGRVAAVNLCGGDEKFPGVLGSTVCRVFDYCVGRTGLTEAAARAEGFDVVTALAPGPDSEHFMPTARQLFLKIVVDAKTRKILGVQAVGPGRGDKRIDLAAVAIASGVTVDQLANMDLCYAPQYSPVMDNLQTAANVARNKLAGYMAGVSAREVWQMISEGRDVLLLDVRTPAEYEKQRLPNSMLVPLGSLRARLDEIPRRPIVTFCNFSLRGYEAALILRHAGFTDVRVLEGGTEMWPYTKLH